MSPLHHGHVTRLILILLLFCDLLSVSLCVRNSLADVLVYYEYIHVSDLRHSIIPRDTSGIIKNNITYRQIHFYSLGRSFSLHLAPHWQLFHPQFEALTINHNGHTQRVHVNKDNFHAGHLIGDDSSVVTAHLSQEGILTAGIKTANETYYVEPAKLHIQGSHDSRMIMYKLSDVKSSGSINYSFSLDYETVPPHTSVLTGATTSSSISKSSHLLKKRQTTSNIRPISCKLALVVDYRFYTFLLSSQNTVITTVVSRLSAVNKFFQSTRWIIDANGNTITNRGLQIGTIIIHTELNSDPSHYNSLAAGQVGVQELLRRFSRGNWANYCLAHLFTHRQFASGKLGLAYIASHDIDETGGICSTRAIDGSSGDVVIYNTGLSVPSSQDRLLLPQEAELVIAHEIGHNWGSPHDPGNDPQCRSHYVMNEFAQDGSMTTHSEFSKCSRRSIGRVLASKSTCFEVVSMSNCGNYKIDSGEECDGGRLTVDDQDPCCDSNCMLRKGRNCSDINHACCLNCAIAPANSKVCHFVGNISNDCTIQTHCNGTSNVCPPPLSAPEGSTCLQGKCQYVNSSSSIQCVPLCSIAGLQSCTCQGKQRCVECCLNTTGDGICQPLLSDSNEVTYFPNGVFCGNGICVEGECVDQTQDFASLLWSVITTLNINKFALFLKENIVGCVCLISLLIWIPGACIFHWLCDVKQIWKKFRRRDRDSNDGRLDGPAFITQSSWVKADPTGRPELTPLLSIEEEEIIDSDLFQAVEEPEDTMPLPQGYSQYSTAPLTTNNSSSL